MGSTVCYEMMTLCTGSIKHSINGWYLVVLNQYKVVLVNSGWYWVNIGNVCLYIYIEKVDIWSSDTDPSQIH